MAHGVERTDLSLGKFKTVVTRLRFTGRPVNVYHDPTGVRLLYKPLAYNGIRQNQPNFDPSQLRNRSAYVDETSNLITTAGRPPTTLNGIWIRPRGWSGRISITYPVFNCTVRFLSLSFLVSVTRTGRPGGRILRSICHMTFFHARMCP